MVELKKKLKTKVFNQDGFTCVKYWDTIVLKFNESEIILNSDGYKTATTKTRMNEASNEFNLGLRVYQDKSVWYIEFKGEVLRFEDNIVLKRELNHNECDEYI